MGGDLGEFTCGKRWASLRGADERPTKNYKRPSGSRPSAELEDCILEARWPDLQWGWRPHTGHRAKILLRF